MHSLDGLPSTFTATAHIFLDILTPHTLAFSFSYGFAFR